MPHLVGSGGCVNLGYADFKKKWYGRQWYNVHSKLPAMKAVCVLFHTIKIKRYGDYYQDLSQTES